MFEWNESSLPLERKCPRTGPETHVCRSWADTLESRSCDLGDKGQLAEQCENAAGSVDR